MDKSFVLPDNIFDIWNKTDKRIMKLGDPILSAQASRVDFPLSETTISLINYMKEVLNQNPGVGLAAPQVGESLRIIIYKAPESQNIYTLINPKITASKGEVISEEGCLSLPLIYGKVKRASNITVRYQNEHGETNTEDHGGIEAIIIQHETDHLNGVLFIDKVMPETLFVLTKPNSNNLLSRLFTNSTK